jgi:hypothetical protein
MAIDPGPHQLDSTRPIFAPPGRVSIHEVTPTFYPDLDKSFPSFGGHSLIQHSTFTSRGECGRCIRSGTSSSISSRETSTFC